MWSVYVMAKEPAGFLHCGYTENLPTTIQFYKKIAVWGKPQYLCYYEQAENKDAVVERFNEFTNASHAALRDLILKVNPEMMEYTV